MTTATEDTSEVEPWLRAYYDGAVLREVAALAGVSHQAISGRLRTRGIRARTRAETAELRLRLRLRGDGDTVRTTFLGTHDVAATARAVGLSERDTRRCLSLLVPDYRVLAATSHGGRRRYTTRDLIDSLRDAASASGPGPLSRRTYSQFVRQRPTLPDDRDRPRPQTVTLRFGSWGEALAAAGLPCHPRPPRTRELDLDRAEAVESVLACWQALGRPPTVSAYERWRRDDRGRPSAARVRRHFVSWHALLVRAWQIRYAP